MGLHSPNLAVTYLIMSILRINGKMTDDIEDFGRILLLVVDDFGTHTKKSAIGALQESL